MARGRHVYAYSPLPGMNTDPHRQTRRPSAQVSTKPGELRGACGIRTFGAVRRAARQNHGLALGALGLVPFGEANVR